MKVSLVLLVALAGCALLRHRSAAVRHSVLAAAIWCAAAMPLVEPLVPSWSVAIGPAAILLLPGREEARVAAPAVAVGSGERHTADPRRAPSRPGAAAWLLAIWTAGTAASLITLLVGWLRLRRFAVAAEDIRSGPWADACDAIAPEHGVSRPLRLLCGSHPGLLVTWGLFRPAILIPRAALTWDESRIHVVLQHELAHVARGDWATQLAAEILRCVYWFNPLTWITCQRLRRESEHAADDAVLLRGVPPAEYAAHLVELARSMTRHRRAWAAAPAIARPSSLERRITAMLNHRLDRQPLSRGARLGGGALVVSCTVVVASLVFAQSGSARFAGSVSDPTGAPLPDTTISLTHRASGVTHALPTDQAGGFVFATLPAGEYLLEARAAGFAAVTDAMTLAAGDSMQREFRMNIGSIEETINVGQPAAGPRLPRPPIDVAGIVNRFRGQRLQPPIKLNHVAPVYSASLLDGAVEGQVVLMAHVAADGSVTDIEVITAAHPDLVSASIDAARQWRFEPTRLWGTPVEVPIKMTFNFRAAHK